MPDIAFPSAAIANPKVYNYLESVQAGRQAADDAYKLNQRNVLAQAGQLAASGDLKGASAALFKGGNFEAGLGLRNQLRTEAISNEDRARQHAQQFQDRFTRMLNSISTPEQFEAAKEAAKRAGIPAASVDKYSFADLPYLRNQAMTVAEQINAQINAAKLQQDKYAASNGVVYSTRTGLGPNGQPASTGYDNVSNPTLARELAKADVKNVSEATGQGSNAQTTLNELNQLEGLRNQTNFEGSILNNATTRLIGRNFGGGLGIIPTTKDVAALDAMSVPATNLTLNYVNQTKGAVSDKETALFQSATPGGQMSDKAASQILPAMRAGAERKQQQGLFKQQWLRTYGTLRGADAAWKAFVDQNPVISQAQDGSLIVNSQNIANWQPYFAAGPNGAVAAPPAAPQSHDDPLGIR